MSKDKKQLSDEELDGKAMKDAFKSFYEKKTGNEYVEGKEPQFTNPSAGSASETATAEPVMPKMNLETPEDFQSRLSQQSDPDLIVGYEIVDLPSQGKFYPDGLKQVKIEYLTSKDEDVLTTPSLIQDGTVLDVILKRKIKTPNVDPANLLTGDKNALILFLRASSYGQDYEVQVTDPRNGKSFKEVVDLTKLKSKEVTEEPDSVGEFFIELPMRKKIVKFKLLTSGEEDMLYKRAESIKDAYGMDHSEYSTMKLKAHVVEIAGNRDSSYISQFIDAMPLRDVVALRKKILNVAPDVDMTYEFKTKDGFKFEAQLTVGVDFFFPSL